MKKIKTDWVRCPACGNKTRDRIREDTILKSYPLYCPKCKREALIEVKDLQVSLFYCRMKKRAVRRFES
ncbi:MAG: conjugal transfer protein [Lachnospiraceae bacterium]|nr:conjugal transfer protein [Lachnospiraceae bacterium]